MGLYIYDICIPIPNYCGYPIWGVTENGGFTSIYHVKHGGRNSWYRDTSLIFLKGIDPQENEHTPMHVHLMVGNDWWLGCPNAVFFWRDFANNMISKIGNKLEHGLNGKTDDQHTDFFGVYSLDWFKGNMTGTPYIWCLKKWFPVDVPLRYPLVN